MMVLVPFLILALLVASLLFKKKAKQTPTAKQAFHAYQEKYRLDGTGRHNRLAFRLLHDSVAFLDDNTCTSALMSPEEVKDLSPDTEVFTVVAAPSSLFGFNSHMNKRAKRAVTLVFRAEPFRAVGIWGRGFHTSWRIDEENIHILDAHFMSANQIENFKEQAVEGYEFNSAY
jgi:hypothetical protein